MKRCFFAPPLMIGLVSTLLLAGCSSNKRPNMPSSSISQTKPCKPGQIGCCPDKRRYCNVGARYQPDASWLDWAKHGFKLLTGAYPGKEALPKDLVLPQEEASQQLALAYKRPNSLTWFGHSTFLIRVGGKTIMTDPTITKRIGRPPITVPRLVPVRPPWESIKQLDAILISHGDYDHLSVSSLLKLTKKFPGLEIIIPEGSKRFLPKLHGVRITEMSWYDSKKLGSLSINFVPAVHGLRRPPHRADSAHWGGYIIKHHKRKLYFAGDIAEGTVYKDIVRRYGKVDTALIPIGGYAPQSFNRAFHATPKNSLKIARTVGAREAIPMHWGTFSLSEESGLTQKQEILKASHTLPEAPKLSLFKIGQSRKIW